MDVRSAEFLQESETFMQDANIHTKCIVYVCFDNESFSLLTALSLPQPTKENNVPIVVRMIRDTWSNFLTEEDNCDFGCLQIFGLLDRTLQPELILGGMHESLARSIHNDYIRRQINMGYTLETNPSIVSWDMLSSEFKELNRNRADRIITQLKAIGCYIGPLSDWDIESFKFSDDEIETIAKMEHKQYVEERTNKGFRYGINKDNDKKTNPNPVPWAKLDDKVKDQNREEIRRFPALLAQVDLQIYRMTK